MSRNTNEEIAGWRQELKDLQEAISWEDPPLAPRTRAIAEAKIATLQRQLAAINTNRHNEPTMAELDPVPIETHPSEEKKPSTAPLDGWRCDLCGEIVTAQERPLVPPEKCSRCSSSNMTSMEVWAARRPPLGLWTR
jgi:rubrerythrin